LSDDAAGTAAWFRRTGIDALGHGIHRNLPFDVLP
jgi:hypothetical protein